jgi:hypothetical protein
LGLNPPLVVHAAIYHVKTVCWSHHQFQSPWLWRRKLDTYLEPVWVVERKY